MVTEHGLLVLFIILRRLFCLKDIGAKLKEARESVDISIEEAATDLKVSKSQIENIESGNMEAFQDIFYLKYFIRDYAKYLGLNYDELVDEFNEYLFDYTSKISLIDIEEANNKEEEKKDKIRSPYTNDYYQKKSYLKVFLLVLVILIIAIIVGIVFFSR